MAQSRACDERSRCPHRCSAQSRAQTRPFCYGNVSVGLSLFWKRQGKPRSHDISLPKKSSQNYDLGPSALILETRRCRAQSKGRGGLHVADLLPPTTKRPNLCRFVPDLLNPVNRRDPRQQIGGFKQRSNRGHEELGPHRPKSRPDSEFPEQVRSTRFQIFIKTPEGKTRLVWVHAEGTILQLKQQIWIEMGYPDQHQHLVSGGRSLQECRTMKSYEISPGTTIILNLRLRGGSPPQGQPSSSGGGKGKTTPQQQPKGGLSYKNILQGNKTSGPSPDHGGNKPKPYIVDQLGQTPALNLDSTGLDDFVKSYETQALICRFNSFWPKPMDLFHWIFNNWTMECDIHLCSKGFFIVRFTSTEVRDTVISAGPWFWGTAGLFMTPWFPDFDPNKMTVSKVPVWVRLYNLPLHFWSKQVLEGIGNSIGKYIKTDLERIDERVYTFARICVEVDLSKVLPDNIRLIYKQQNWLQALDYENTAFRCRLCRQTGHLQRSCPEDKKVNSRKKQKGKQRKGWQFPPPDSEDEESEAEEEDPKAENAEVTQKTETQKGTTSVAKDSQYHSKQAEKNQVEMTSADHSMGGSKRHHQSDTSDSDKEPGLQTTETQLVITSIEPSIGEWRKVEKKKGRKT